MDVEQVETVATLEKVETQVVKEMDSLIDEARRYERLMGLLEERLINVLRDDTPTPDSEAKLALERVPLAYAMHATTAMMIEQNWRLDRLISRLEN